MSAGTVVAIDLEGIDTSAGTLRDPYLRLYNSVGGLIDEDDDAGTGYNSQISYAVSLSGTYYIAAGAFADSYGGTYTVRATASSSSSDDFADNLADATAPIGIVAANGTSTGRLEIAGDRDWFRVQLTAGVNYTIQLRGSDSSLGTLDDPYLRLHNSSGALLTEDDDSGVGVDSQLSFTANATGTFYLEAGAFADAFTGTYTVSIRSTASDPDFLTGTPGPDFLDGSVPGNQTMDGGAGDDTYIVGGPGDVVIEGSGPGSGIDTIASLAAQYTLPANVETMVLAGTGNIGGTGNALNNLMIGNEGANMLDGVDGNDALAGAGGNDYLIGGLGDDFLNGGPGNDTMDGGPGNDFYVVDSFGDVILPEGIGPGSGTDVVASAVSFNLGPGLEVLVMAPGAVTATGNELDNTIFANDAPNVLLGGGGVDVLAGGGGNDTIDGGPGDDVLMGGAGTDSITGGAGNDYLDGELGNDTLVGGDGNDTYIVDSPFDVVVEAAGAIAGSNDIVASTTSYALGANVESLILAGFGNIAGAGNVLGNYMIGNGGDNTLDGQSGDDTISAGAGNDRLLGGYGDDFLVGGPGNDSFVFFGGFGRDSVADFAAGPGLGDVIEFHDGLFSGFADVLAHARQTGGNVTITANDPANAIILFNTALGSLNADDFRFL